MLYKINIGAEGYRIRWGSFVMELLRNKVGVDCALLIQGSYLPYLKKNSFKKEEYFHKEQVVFDPDNFSHEQTPGVYLVCKSLATNGYFGFKIDTRDVMVVHGSMIEKV
jgi:hypothetical protein